LGPASYPRPSPRHRKPLRKRKRIRSSRRTLSLPSWRYEAVPLASAENLPAPIRNRKSRTPAPRCSQPASMRRGCARFARHAPARPHADDRLYASRVQAERLAVLDFEEERRAMPVPKLGGTDLVPVRQLARLEQKQDRRRVSTPMRPALVAERLSKPTAFGMWLELQMRDHLVGGQSALTPRIDPSAV
jgi:hypothetical protein